MTPPRWVAATHEAGHLVAARVLLNATTVTAMISSHGGWCRREGGSEQSPLLAILAIACGTAAESLAFDHPPPSEPHAAEPPGGAAPPLPAAALHRTGGERPASDRDLIWDWATAGGTQLTGANRRRTQLWEAANQFVADFTTEILAIATELHRRGRFTLGE